MIENVPIDYLKIYYQFYVYEKIAFLCVTMAS